MKHRDFVILVRGTEEINALVAASHDVYTPATQTEEASTSEHLTLVFLEPTGAGIPTGEALRNSVQIKIDVPPVSAAQHFGWKEVPTFVDGSGSDRYAAWTDGSDGTGYPGEKDQEIADLKEANAKLTEMVTAQIEETKAVSAKLAVAAKPAESIVPADDVVQTDPAIAEAVANPTE